MALIDLIASVPDDNTALVRPESDFRLTYGALRRQVQILAGALREAGVQKNERVAIALPNAPALVVAILAAYEATEAAGDASASRFAILDADGRPLEPGRPGEVAFAGPSVVRGYDNDPERTRKFFVDGWFRTGDFGYRDHDVRVTLSGVRG